MYIFVLGLLCSLVLEAHEFMHVSKPRRVSLSKLKEQAADELSEQLRITAEVVQSLGTAQVVYYEQKSAPDFGPEAERLRDIGVRIYHCRLQYADLLACVPLQTHPFEQKHMSLPALFGYLSQTIGVVQQHIVMHIQDLFEDKGRVFVKEHASRLSDVIKMIKGYTYDIKAMRDALSDVIKKMSVCKHTDICSESEKESKRSAKKA